MKSYKLFLFVLMLMSLPAIGQKVQTYGGVEYYTNNKIRLQTYDQSCFFGSTMREITHDNGQMNMIIGLRYNPIDWVFAYIDTQTFLNPLKVTRYDPVQSFYTIGAGIKYDKFKLKIEHACYHPSRTSGKTRTELYGGYTKLGLYFNMP